MAANRIAPWISVSSLEKLPMGSSVIGKLESISLELSVLLAQPQSSWHLLLKVHNGFGILKQLKKSLLIKNCSTSVADKNISIRLKLLSLSIKNMNWIFVFKVLMMNDCWVASQILLHISKKPFSIGSSSEEERKCKGI